MAVDVHGATTHMAEQAAQLDITVSELRRRAKELKEQTRAEADEHVEHARKMAASMMANATTEADKLLSKATDAEETAAWWRRMAFAERQEAQLPPLPQPDPDWRAYLLPNGQTVDLMGRFSDSAGAVWKWSGEPGGFGEWQGGRWPLMSQTDLSVIDVPLPGCPPLTPVLAEDSAPPPDAGQPANGDRSSRRRKP